MGFLIITETTSFNIKSVGLSVGDGVTVIAVGSGAGGTAGTRYHANNSVSFTDGGAGGKSGGTGKNFRNGDSGGGGGGGNTSLQSYSGNGGNGGGAGKMTFKFVTLNAETIPVTIGKVVAADTAGQTTSFGSLVTAKGGAVGGGGTGGKGESGSTAGVAGGGGGEGGIGAGKGGNGSVDSGNGRSYTGEAGGGVVVIFW